MLILSCSPYSTLTTNLLPMAFHSSIKDLIIPQQKPWGKGGKERCLNGEYKYKDSGFPNKTSRNPHDCPCS